MPPRDLHASMWAQACAMLDRAEQLQRQFFQPAQRLHQPRWEPPMDVFETAAELWLVLALPGVDPAGIEVTRHGDVLVVSGERRLPVAVRAAQIHRLEIPHGRFERRLALPAGRLELRRTQALDGCLYIVLAKGRE